MRNIACVSLQVTGLNVTSGWKNAKGPCAQIQQAAWLRMSCAVVSASKVTEPQQNYLSLAEADLKEDKAKVTYK